jgi:hypothetical protein
LTDQSVNSPVDTVIDRPVFMPGTLRRRCSQVKGVSYHIVKMINIRLLGWPTWDVGVLEQTDPPRLIIIPLIMIITSY